MSWNLQHLPQLPQLLNGLPKLRWGHLLREPGDVETDTNKAYLLLFWLLALPIMCQIQNQLH